jgi:hypothetical protein
MGIVLSLGELLVAAHLLFTAKEELFCYPLLGNSKYG